MEYVNPIGKTGDKVPYVDADPANGIEGDPVASDAWEHTMLEIVNFIESQGLTPDSNDLTQLTQAIAAALGEYAPAIGTLSDVDTTDLSVGQILKFDGTKFVPVNPEPGLILQRKYVEFGNYLQTANTIPRDDTPPQISEGVEIASLEITPLLSTTRLRVVANYPYCYSPGSHFYGALFRDATADAIAVSGSVGLSGGNASAFQVIADVASLDTVLTTFSTRFGCSSGTASINGELARELGGKAKVFLSVEEYQP